VLLQRTFLSCEQVMAQVGLHDTRRFEREFKSAHGVTPAEFRRERS
jgi:AraC-like DNA-binding protein